MKLTKKIICVAMVAAMSLTSLTAFATVPTPKDNTQAFIYAENYFNQGLYYEAMDELRFVNPIYSHEASKLAMWTHKVQDKITEWELSETFREVERLYNADRVADAYNYLHNNMQRYVNLISAAPTLPSGTLVNVLTDSELDTYTYWVNQLDKGIITEGQAIVAVEQAIGDILWDPEMYYSVVPFGNGWDVYVKSVDTDHNIQAYHVATRLVEGDYDGDAITSDIIPATVPTPLAGIEDYYVQTVNSVRTATEINGLVYREKVPAVTYTAIDYNGNPASEYEWRYDSVAWPDTAGYPEWLRASAASGAAGKAVRDEMTTYVAD